jgi:rubrerythrin
VKRPARGGAREDSSRRYLRDDEHPAIDTYTQFDQETQAESNSLLASPFTSIRGREMGHHQTFTNKLQEVTDS